MCGPHPVASDRQAGKAIAVDQPQLDVGSTAWLLTSAALVLLMTPGVAFFYGGMIRQSNVLSMIMQSLMTIGTVSVLWVLVGFSLAFGAGNGFVGGLDLAGLRDLAQTVPGMHIDGVPILAFAVFQMMFAVVTPVLITGAGAERWRFSAYITFVALWSMLVYAPIAHWFFSPLGWGAGSAHSTSPAARSCMSTPASRHSSSPRSSAGAPAGPLSSIGHTTCR